MFARTSDATPPAETILGAVPIRPSSSEIRASASASSSALTTWCVGFCIVPLFGILGVVQEQKAGVLPGYGWRRCKSLPLFISIP